MKRSPEVKGTNGQGAVVSCLKGCRRLPLAMGLRVGLNSALASAVSETKGKLNEAVPVVIPLCLMNDKWAQGGKLNLLCVKKKNISGMALHAVGMFFLGSAVDGGQGQRLFYIMSL